MVAGQLQKTGRDAEGKVLRADLTSAADTLELDLSSAYPVPSLEHLIRTFTYTRAGVGSLVLTDRVRFSSPQSFSTALITLGSWKKLDDHTLLVTDQDESLHVRIDASAGFSIASEVIKEDAPVAPTRIALEFSKPIAEGFIMLTITPVEKR